MAQSAAQFASHIHKELGKVIVGQDGVIQQIITVLLCRGHALLEGVPGTAKTLAVKALARTCDVAFHRVQCTPDLMPADILGTNIFNLGSSSFALHRGPVFTDLLLVDEINRMPPRTQAALLECMEERQVTLDGTAYALSGRFTVFATQNPVEFEGTYPLPEAELDRFLLKINIHYPAPEQEVEILNRYQNGFDARALDRLDITPVSSELFFEACRDVTAVRVESQLLSYMATVARKTRDWPALSLGASPRATVCLMLAAKALAALDGRDYLLPDDVKTAAPSVLRHRLVVKPEADLEGITPDSVITEILHGVEVPK
ncbi:MAG: AAA family ATPase [Terriglobia bacterium]